MGRHISGTKRSKTEETGAELWNASVCLPSLHLSPAVWSWASHLHDPDSYFFGKGKGLGKIIYEVLLPSDLAFYPHRSNLIKHAESRFLRVLFENERQIFKSCSHVSITSLFLASALEFAFVDFKGKFLIATFLFPIRNWGSERWNNFLIVIHLWLTMQKRLLNVLSNMTVPDVGDNGSFFRWGPGSLHISAAHDTKWSSDSKSVSLAIYLYFQLLKIKK